jgi:hypothetical protein
VKAAAAAAIGGTAVAIGSADRVAAANGDELILGNRGGGQVGSQSAASPTQINYTGSEDIGFLVQAGTTFSATDSSIDAALAGWTFRTANPNGVYGFSDVGGGSGVVGRAGAAAQYGLQALHASGSGTALRAQGGSISGVGVDASGRTAVRAVGDTGVAAVGEFSGAGVLASGGRGIDANGAVHGIRTSGATAALLLTPATTEPGARTDAHVAGEVEAVTESGSGETSFWACVEGGAPGVWRKLAGAGAEGVLHPLEPYRAYDSRVPAPSPGSLSADEDRVVSIKDARDTGNGSVIAADVVPPGATAVSYNITVAGTVNAGFLSVTPGDAASSTASTINWSASGQILANAGIVKLDDARNVKVFCGGVGSTDFIIDITGYYR